MTPEIITLFSKSSVRNVFDVVVKERKIRLKDLRDSLDLKNEEVAESLNRLEEAKLIDEQDAPVEDFKTFYVTADGLSAIRELRRLKLTP